MKFSSATTTMLISSIAQAALLTHPHDVTFLPSRGAVNHTGTAAWPYGPFSTRGRDIVDSRGEAVTWTGINWPGSGETMVPEGLEWESVEDILSRVASVGFNFVRFTYAIEMVDQIYDREGLDVPLEVAMINGLGFVNGTKVTKEIVAKNPGWTKDTTRFQIWDDIAKIAAEKQIFIHPDVHVGKAQWCCNTTDGNSWFDDYNFPVTNWIRGLQYVANWAHSHPNVVSMSLRNELRRSLNVTDLGYHWMNLVGNNSAATDAIHSVNPDILVSWSGMQFDQDLSALTSGKNLLTAPCYKCDAIRDAYRRTPQVFDLDAHAWKDKVFYELHLYSMSEDQDTGDCSVIQAELYRLGFNALGIEKPEGCGVIKDCPDAVRETPVVMTEFGWAQDETLFNDTLQGCIRDFTTKHNVSWAVWALAGSYRVRSGAQGVDDTWALLDYEWSGWRFPEGIEKWWKPWIKSMRA